METSQNWFVKILIAVVVLAVIVFGLIYFIRYKNPPPLVVDSTNNINTEVPEEVGSAMSIIAKHQFKNGEHVLAGEIGLPTPCHILSTRVDTLSADSENIVVHFTSTTQAEACAQVITQVRFKAEFEAPADVQIGATWNGRPATINLFPVGDNEDLKNFDLFIKG